VGDVDPMADIGTHLRNARVNRNLSLREMARRVGVSASFVSQVELGKAKPSLGTLYGFLSVLDLSLDELMPSNGSPLGFVDAAQSDGAPRIYASAAPVGVDHVCQPWTNHPLVQMRGVTWRRLTGDDPMVDFLHVTYDPDSESCPSDNLMRHDGHEYGHIIDGGLRVQIGFETFDLAPGDAINFPSTTPHRLSNVGSSPCTSVWVVVGRRSVSRMPWHAGID
jgi:transcriptional regulator with XRE-family HTH domain